MVVWPSGELRLEGIDVTKIPSEADIFVIPGTIRLFESNSGVLDHAKLNRLPYFKGRESRHVFFDVSDNFTQPINLPIIFLRCDARSWMLPSDMNTIQMAWPVSDYAECVDVPACGFSHDIGFRGWNWSEARQIATKSCAEDSRLNCDFALYSDFFGYRKPEDPEFAIRRNAFKRSLRECRLQLCPVSIESVFPYRYWETLSAGRVPLLVGSDFVFPFADEIDYSAFTVFCPRADADRAGCIAVDFLRSHSDDDIIDMGKLARKTWVQWLDSRKWPELMSYAVQKKLGVAVPA